MAPPRNDQVARLIAEARLAYTSAYCPYSQYPVGAAILTTTGKMYSGCNVENASLGLSTCAERGAIAAGVNAGLHPGDLVALALVVTGGPATPCGACLQVIAEFASSECSIICTDLTGELEYYSLSNLLPQAFQMPR